MHDESEWGGQPNPARGERVRRWLLGCTNLRAEADAEAREERGRTFSLTPDILLDMEAYAGMSDRSDQRMCWAAACLGTFMVLRISELLGSRQHPERALRADQVSFGRGGGTTVSAAPGTPAGMPDIIQLRLGPTKTDQRGTAPPMKSASRPLIQAMWIWMRDRERLISHSRATSPLLFCIPGHEQLAFPALREFRGHWLEQSGRGRPHITGKTFRSGGASGLISRGVSRQDAAAAGRWKTQSMLETYATAQAQQQRLLIISRNMGTFTAGAGL